MIKVSVIVPVYNTEKYLEECLTSLVEQNFDSFEVIVINDGSTDGCQKIIDQFQKDYPQLIRAYSFPNRGISVSRNYGISVAKGKYLTFIDSDDYVHINFLSDMYNRIEEAKADMVVCDYYTVKDGNIAMFKLDDFEDGSIKTNPQLLLKVNSSPCNKLFKKTLFKKFQFEKIKYEDLLLVTKLVCSSKKIVKLNKHLNFFRVRENSETTVVDDRVFDVLKILQNLNSYFEEIGIYEKYYDEIEYFNIYRVAMYVIQERYQKSRKIRKKFIREAFMFLKNNFPNWRKNKYYGKRQFLKKMVESHRFLATLYVDTYRR